MSTLDHIAIRIIKEQELIIGPLAWNEAGKVVGLRVIDISRAELVLEGDARQIIDMLVERYDHLFGRASHEVSRGAVASLLANLAPNEIPASLVK